MLRIPKISKRQTHFRSEKSNVKFEQYHKILRLSMNFTKKGVCVCVYDFLFVERQL